MTTSAKSSARKRRRASEDPGEPRRSRRDPSSDDAQASHAAEGADDRERGADAAPDPDEMMSALTHPESGAGLHCPDAEGRAREVARKRRPASVAPSPARASR
ncbi:MAG TPA: hypothetical protein VFD92_26340 [Candidatus Binatia bacterium]|nr:hypothetical protein [Candidatus Binatia bacterium]